VSRRARIDSTASAPSSFQRGEFVITGNEGDLAYDLEVECQAYAKKRVELIPTGDAVYEITVTEGATVTGRILSDDKPAIGINVILMQCVHGGVKFVGRYSSVTDRDGRFGGGADRPETADGR
jgi:hypothetical protein